MAIIDWEQFNENFQYYDKEIIKEVIDIFLDGHDERINLLQKNIDEKDYVSLAFNTHSLKSVISNYMAPVVLKLTIKLENLAKENMESQIPKTFEELKVATKELLLELQNYISNSK